MPEFFILQNTPSTPEWNNIFTTVLDHCDQFEVFYPDGEFDEENPLMGGKLDFEKLESTFSNTWDGMDNSVCIRGNLTSESKNIIFKFMEPSFSGDKPELWHINLLKSGTLYLSVEDFTVCVLENHPEIISLFQQIGISTEIFDNF
ncbi:hypothetical protein [Psychrobacillus psychrotolerans]|uniref:hypothetical protein n=1 Tax=Psychrobacillus psychrotolerans TaxID=126156 RepID=UPI003315EEE2